uniref:Uncharacterized protein n=1 Tax=Arcella intermedia TaxID=1963864 RepID=A0A6B2LP80_9EUKA
MIEHDESGFTKTIPPLMKYFVRSLPEMQVTSPGLSSVMIGARFWLTSNSPSMPGRTTESTTLFSKTVVVGVAMVRVTPLAPVAGAAAGSL